MEIQISMTILGLMIAIFLVYLGYIIGIAKRDVVSKNTFDRLVEECKRAQDNAKKAIAQRDQAFELTTELMKKNGLS